MTDRALENRAAHVASNPPWWPVMGRLRDAVVELRRATQTDLAAVDLQLAELMERRRQLVERVVGCNRALTGTGVERDEHGRRSWHARTSWTIPFEDPIPEVGASGSRDEVVDGDPETIRARCCAYLRAAGPLSIDELHRLLALDGVRIDGYAPKVIANALRAAERRGAVCRVQRGVYAAVTS